MGTIYGNCLLKLHLSYINREWSVRIPLWYPKNASKDKILQGLQKCWQRHVREELLWELSENN